MLDTRELGRRPGSQRRVSFTAEAPAELGIEILGVPEGAPVDFDLRLEAVMEGVLVTGTATADLEGECARCLDPIEDQVTVDLQESYWPLDDSEPVVDTTVGKLLREAAAEAPDRTALVAGEYSVEERMTLDAVVRSNGSVLGRTWALNEAVVEKTTRGRILEVVLEVDGRPVSGFGCDGVLCSTPTGSTAYAFSAGGPLVWPQVQALLVVPSNAHALFARPMVIAPDSAVAIEVSASGPSAVLDCDGRRTISVPPGARVELSRAAHPVRMVRLAAQPFADRLVRKFDLPVRGWRGAPRTRETEGDGERRNGAAPGGDRTGVAPGR